MLSVSEAQLFEWVTVLLLPVFRIMGLMTAAPVLSRRPVQADLATPELATPDLATPDLATPDLATGDPPPYM